MNQMMNLFKKIRDKIKSNTPSHSKTSIEESSAHIEEHSQSQSTLEYHETLYANPMLKTTEHRDIEKIESSIDNLSKKEYLSEIDKAVDRLLARKQRK